MTDTDSGNNGTTPPGATGTALVSVRGQSLNQEDGESGVRDRDTRALEYIDKSKQYWELRTKIDWSSDTTGKNLREADLFSWPRLPDDLGHRLGLARVYFRFRVNFFKFADRQGAPAANDSPPKDEGAGVAPRRPRDSRDGWAKRVARWWGRLQAWADANRNTVLSLLLKPSTQTDSDEEDLELKFPDDRKTRALIRAATIVVEHNQIEHIRAKRALQSRYSLVCLGVMWGWWAVGPVALQAFGVPAGIVGDAVWALCLAVAAAPTYFLATGRFGELLHFTTNEFRAANRDSCKELSSQLKDIMPQIQIRFDELLKLLDNSLKSQSLLLDASWPGRAKRIYKMAMWEGLRLEGIERFRQGQLERLRRFYLVSDRLGNFSSGFIWISLALLPALVVLPLLLLGMASWWTYLIVVAAGGLIARRFSHLSTHTSASFNIDDLKEHTSPERWSEHNPAASPGSAAEQANAPRVQHLDYFKKLSDSYQTALETYRGDRLQRSGLEGKTSADLDADEHD